MSGERDIHVMDDDDGGISVVMCGDAADRFQMLADEHRMTVQELGDKLLRDALARGIL